MRLRKAALVLSAGFVLIASAALSLWACKRMTPAILETGSSFGEEMRLMLADHHRETTDR